MNDIIPDKFFESKTQSAKTCRDILPHRNKKLFIKLGYGFEA